MGDAATNTQPIIVRKGITSSSMKETPTIKSVRDVRKYERIVLSTANSVRYAAKFLVVCL